VSATFEVKPRRYPMLTLSDPAFSSGGDPTFEEKSDKPYELDETSVTHAEGRPMR
jgi:hypothetical protein